MLPTLLLSIDHIQENTLSTHPYQMPDDTRIYRYEKEQLINCSMMKRIFELNHHKLVYFN